MPKRPFYNATHFLCFLCIMGSLVSSCSDLSQPIPFDPPSNARIVIVGNTFAEQLQTTNYFETLLYQSFPDRNLVVRNLGWSGDEVDLQPRPLDFGSLEDNLSYHRPDYIFAFFGMNEAFQGADGLPGFEQNLRSYLQKISIEAYNGKTLPQVVLFSPIYHEEIGGLLPSPDVHNGQLRAYTRKMTEVARQLNIPFVDLYELSKRLMSQSDEYLTYNGIHLTDVGYRMVSESMARSLGFTQASWGQAAESLRQLIGIKNRQFFHRFRSQNGEYISGSRKHWKGGQTLPDELAQLDSILLRLDSLVWKGASENGPLALQQAKEIFQAFEVDRPRAKTYTPSTDQFILPEGYRIELFASEQNFPIANPVSISFDPKGRLWVASMPSYPHVLPGQLPNDKLVILEDKDGDGVADHHTVFADSLYLPLGFELGDGGVYLTQAPDLVFLKDTNGDGKADYRGNLLHGFGTEDAHHAISAYTWGPDGALYMHEGTFLHSQVETPYGPVRGAYGNTWRYEPRTMKLEPYVSYPYANPWGNAFMRNGTHLIGDVSTGMNYLATPLTVATEYPKKHVGMKDFLTSTYKPKTCGMEIISSSNFPDEAQGNILFNTFVGFQGIRQHRIIPQGSGIVAEELEPLLQSMDLNFRPVDLKFGPDGALYVVDWYNPIIQHGEQGFRDSLRDQAHGRIWKITYTKKALNPVLDLTKLALVELLDQLKEDEDRVRYRARMQLREFSDTEILPVLDTWVNELDKESTSLEQDMLEGLWVYQQFHRPNRRLLDRLLAANDPDIRAAATRVLFYWREHIPETETLLAEKISDSSAKVRLEAIAALSHFRSKRSVEALLNATNWPMDDYIDYALKEAFKPLRPIWMEMFQENPEFLKGDSVKTALILGPLVDPEKLPLPGFLKTDPHWAAYSWPPLTSEEFAAISHAPAVMQFLKISDDAFVAGEQKGASGLAEGDVDARRGLKGAAEVIKVVLTTLPGEMVFDKKQFTVPAGMPVEIHFSNPDDMPHNLLILSPNSLEAVGRMADEMAKLPDGYNKDFIPESDRVLAATPLVTTGEQYVLQFTAPSEPGEYPFACTFPGHWRIMNGLMKVERPSS
ncbi:MAG: HEAT repeat domain-containing protein [Lunatimonas sp.]|uniref:PVC-type heme-binding CxxCH protein n=1 Tax=Lunatimonas sp. TaxID=2060141 RepID=UPI00263B9D36|nr:PVC-type heme-binding CxxCH protein [Lunatimonas sp.]MCC5937131.1 HEAT repeat domain-containing protein [Lunatimonas sp.]